MDSISSPITAGFYAWGFALELGPLRAKLHRATFSPLMAMEWGNPMGWAWQCFFSAGGGFAPWGPALMGGIEPASKARLFGIDQLLTRLAPASPHLTD